MSTEDGRVAALESFKDWSNYLLVTTVAAAGWIASDNVTFWSTPLKSAALWSLGVSIVFGILALALVPLVAQQMQDSDQSIYHVRVCFKIFTRQCHAYLTQACRPQHVTFIVGIAFFCLGTVQWPWLGLLIGAIAAAFGWFSKPTKTERNEPPTSS
ncbi:hypothetical protein [Virgisporangium aurantiacum]|nr:hypothetical protein [Virgisporangium aurantiacum]